MSESKTTIKGSSRSIAILIKPVVVGATKFPKDHEFIIDRDRVRLSAEGLKILVGHNSWDLIENDAFLIKTEIVTVTTVTTRF